jgi:Tfp pilus assembly protein PilO
MKQSTKRLMSSMLALAFIVGSFVVLFIFIQPEYGKISTMRGQKQGLESYVAEQGRIVDSVEGLIQNYAQNADQRQALLAVLPFEPDIATIIGQVNGIAVMHGLAPQSYDAKLPTDLARQRMIMTGQATSTIGLRATSTVELTVDLVGSYEDIKGFLGDIETNIRLLDVSNLSFERTDTEGRELYTVKATIRAYYQPSTSS